MSEHGPQYDEFPINRSDTHGGATFDEGFNSFAAAHTNAHGKLFDKFSERPGVDRYGERWDNFPWRDMPSLHGEHFDSGFDAPSFDADKHGQLHDVFRGSRVRYLYGGQDVEGIVLDTQRDFAVVESREGDRHEVTLPQVLAYATQSGHPSNDAGHVANPADPYGLGQASESEVGTNSSPSAPANGGKRKDGGSYDDTVVTHVKALDEALEVVKSLDHPFDEAEFDRDAADFAEVAKTNGNPGVAHLSTKKLTEAHAKFSDHYTAARLTGNHERASFAATVLASVHHELAHRGVMADKPDEGHQPVTRGLSVGHQPLRNKTAPDDVDVAKDVDSTETAVQNEDVSQGANWCKTCQHYCRRVENGHCPTCGGPVGVRKSVAGALEVLKEMREPNAPWKTVGHKTIGYRTSTQKYLCKSCGTSHKKTGEAVPLHAEDAESHSYGSCQNCGKKIA